MPSWTVTVRRLAMPSPTSIVRIASDAQMKQSTCRYFHRDNALPRRWKSTRLDAISRGCVGSVLIDRAIAAIATPCGSWAWTTSGRSCLSEAGQPPRGGEVHLGARRQREEVQSLLGAAAQLSARVRNQGGAMTERAQAQHRDEHLVLSAPPRARRIDVD